MATRLSNYSIFSAIMDPFVAIHAYSGILPVGSSQLPHWTIAQAMQSMTAFFHYSPLLVTQPIPKNFDPNYWAGLVPEVVDQTDKVAIPALKSAKWAWLQPYEVLPTERAVKATTQDKGDAQGSGAPYEVLPTGTAVKAITHDKSDTRGNGANVVAVRGTDLVADKFTQYTALAAIPSDQKPRYEGGPYTAIEGYLQLLEPLMLAEGEKRQPPT